MPDGVFIEEVCSGAAPCECLPQQRRSLAGEAFRRRYEMGMRILNY